MGDLSCKTKIILDGQNLRGLTEGLCEASDALPAEFFTDAIAYPIIKHLNEAEAQIIEAQKKLMKAVEYDGPLPNYLK